MSTGDRWGRRIDAFKRLRDHLQQAREALAVIDAIDAEPRTALEMGPCVQGQQLRTALLYRFGKLLQSPLEDVRNVLDDLEFEDPAPLADPDRPDEGSKAS